MNNSVGDAEKVSSTGMVLAIWVLVECNQSKCCLAEMYHVEFQVKELIVGGEGH